jgi:hypothetical protein
LKIIARELVVPWSNDKMYFSIKITFRFGIGWFI